MSPSEKDDDQVGVVVNVTPSREPRAEPVSAGEASDGLRAGNDRGGMRAAISLATFLQGGKRWT